MTQAAMPLSVIASAIRKAGCLTRCRGRCAGSTSRRSCASGLLTLPATSGCVVRPNTSLRRSGEFMESSEIRGRGVDPIRRERRAPARDAVSRRSRGQR
jgi:hypothetical protein